MNADEVERKLEAARQKLLVKEKELTRVRDAMAAERRRMPWLAVKKKYEFDGPKGKSSLRLSLFGADPQADYEAITRSTLGRLIAPQQPEDSLLLLKGTGTVSHGGEVRLTAKEFLLLRYLLEHQGRVLSRDLLLSDVWGYAYTGGTRTVDVHVRRLREKLPMLGDALVTVKQFGYKLSEHRP